MMALLALATVGSLCAAVPEHVIVISIDGLRSDLMDRVSTPNLDLVARTGCRAVAARSVKPAVTLPAHASMLSGLLPERHGFVFNSYQPERGFLQSPTLLSALAATGRKVGAFLGKRKLLQLVVPGSIHHVEHAGYNASRVLDHALPYLVEERPDLLFVHFPDPDSAGHETGWGSPEQLAAVEACDRQVGRIFRSVYESGMLRTTAFLILADHGGNGRAHGLHHPSEFQIEWMAAGLGIEPGHRIEAPVSVLDTFATVFALLDLEPPAGLDGHVVAEALYGTSPDGGTQAPEEHTRLGWVPEDMVLPEAPAPAADEEVLPVHDEDCPPLEAPTRRPRTAEPAPAVAASLAQPAEEAVEVRQGPREESAGPPPRPVAPAETVSVDPDGGLLPPFGRVAESWGFAPPGA